MTSYIYISSQDERFTGEAHTFDIELNSSDTFSLDNSTLSIDSVSFSNLQYPINRFNNTVIFQENGVAVNITATIAEGNYTILTFCAALKSALENHAGAPTYTCSVSSTSNKLTISSTGTLKLIGGTALLKVMGFAPTSGFAASSVGGYPINLSGANYVDIVIGNFTTKSTKSGRNIGEIFARVPLDKSFGSMIQWNNPNDDNIQVAGTINNLHFEMYDEFGNPYEMPLNGYVSVVIKVMN